MAWPTTPLTAYVAGTTPAIKAADLNALQDAQNKTLLGTYTHKAIALDGAGGDSANVPTIGGTPVKLVATDQANNVKYRLDSIGFPIGNLSIIEENWAYGKITAPIITADNTLMLGDRWVYRNGGGPSIQIQQPSGNYMSRALRVAPGVTASVRGTLYSGYCVRPNSNISLALEFSLYDDTQTVDADFAIGLSDIVESATNCFLPTEAQNFRFIGFRRASGGLWQACTQNSIATRLTDSAAFGHTTSSHTFRVEFHGDNTFYGRMCRYFIDGILLAEHDTSASIPQGTSLSLVIQSLHDGSSSAANTMYVSPIKLVTPYTNTLSDPGVVL